MKPRVFTLVISGGLWLAAAAVHALPPAGICTIRAGERPIDQQRRRLDALGALEWLAQQRGVARDRIALVGWSHGGTTLVTIDAGNHDVASFRDRA